MNIEEHILQLGSQASAASRLMSVATAAAKRQSLKAAAEIILETQEALVVANSKDLEIGKERGLNDALLDRLELTPARIAAMADGLEQVAALPDPIGMVRGMAEQPSGIRVGRMRVPLGVIGIIYESRPNVTADASGLCLKSGNAVILRGGSEAFHSNKAIVSCMQEGLRRAKLPKSAVQFIATTDRAAVGVLLGMDAHVDMIIPRGGKGLIKRVSAEAKMPVLKHLDGICHVYVDCDACPEKAVRIAFNAKTQRYGTCNTMECLLVAERLAKEVLDKLEPMYAHAGVELRGCPKTQALLGAGVKSSSAEDYATEYLAPILSIKVLSGLDEAIEHIAHFGSAHTDSIITENFGHAQRFLREVDSSSVMVNASTRFADGYEYGLGAEIGISTDKFHARGPVGLEGLSCEKYIVIGDGHIRV
ncbi:MAG: glutamate-5-semialdehyde dehydrogenase [Candidatus Eutrophobiaceae bacterium]